MRIKADTSKCQGYGNCVDLDPDHFDLNDHGLVVLLRDTVDKSERDTVGGAVRSCPASAVWVDDES